MSDSITIMVGLNAALQKRFILPEPIVLIPGNVHRASAVQTGVGGKGQNAATAMSCLHYQLPLRLAQFIGTGSEGDFVWNLLQQRWGKEALEISVRPATPLRISTSVVTCDETTELVDPSGIITKEEMKKLLDSLEHLVMTATQKQSSSIVSALCIMGSMPPGCPDETYSLIYNIVAKSRPFCLIDSVIGLGPLLQAIGTMAPNRGPTLLKVNAPELCKLAGVSKLLSETGGILRDELIQAVQGFVQVYPYAKQALDALAITDGKHPAHVIAFHDTKASIYELPIPKLNTVATTSHLYPIGAGDSVAGATVAAWQALTIGPCLDGSLYEALSSANSVMADDNIDDPIVRKMIAAFSFGLTCGSASCLHPENAQFDIADVVRLHGDRSPGRFQETIPIN